MRLTYRVKKDFCFCDFNGHYNYADLVDYVLKSKLHIDQRKNSLRIFRSGNLNDVINDVLSEYFNNDIASVDFLYYSYSVAETINENFYKRLSRLRSRVRDMVKYGEDVTFVTLTFTDDVLNSTSAETRRRYVSRWFRNFENHYIANIDFGTEKGREHYHGLVCATPDSEPYSYFNGRPCFGFHIDAPIENQWLYGIYDAEIIRDTEDDVKRLTTYINKLTNHAMKETTEGSRIIYDRIPFPNKRIKKMANKTFYQKETDAKLSRELDLYLKLPTQYLEGLDTSSSVILALDARRKLKNL